MGLPRVRDVMREVVVTAREDSPLLDVVKAMVENGVGSMIITDDENRVIGVFTERDLMRLVGNSEDLSRLVVGEVMTRNVVVIEDDASLVKAVHLMAKHNIRHLPVINSEGKLVGVISIRDAAIALARALVNMSLGGLELTEEETAMLRDIADVDEGRGL
ncbi:CBS domain-containing protein [Vulcanisaeta thermophila]|uniref:CBS domain-containing protein n=1 Tax=Vulcanisaeta thermophila TaxID=867917 RepID=UPI0008537002|nr:CBS domain-containing protein [Vulcanisaeta thermophila]